MATKYRCCATCRATSLVQLDDSATSAPIRAIAFDPSGSLLLSGGDDKTLCVWQIDSRQLLHKWYVLVCQLLGCTRYTCVELATCSTASDKVSEGVFEVMKCGLCEHKWLRADAHRRT